MFILEINATESFTPRARTAEGLYQELDSATNPPPKVNTTDNTDEYVRSLTTQELLSSEMNSTPGSYLPRIPPTPAITPTTINTKNSATPDTFTLQERSLTTEELLGIINKNSSPSSPSSTRGNGTDDTVKSSPEEPQRSMSPEELKKALRTGAGPRTSSEETNGEEDPEDSSKKPPRLFGTKFAGGVALYQAGKMPEIVQVLTEDKVKLINASKKIKSAEQKLNIAKQDLYKARESTTPTSPEGMKKLKNAAKKARYKLNKAKNAKEALQARTAPAKTGTASKAQEFLGDTFNKIKNYGPVDRLLKKLSPVKEGAQVILRNFSGIGGIGGKLTPLITKIHTAARFIGRGLQLAKGIPAIGQIIGGLLSWYTVGSDFLQARKLNGPLEDAEKLTKSGKLEKLQEDFDKKNQIVAYLEKQLQEKPNDFALKFELSSAKESADLAKKELNKVNKIIEAAYEINKNDARIAQENYIWNRNLTSTGAVSGLIIGACIGAAAGGIVAIPGAIIGFLAGSTIGSTAAHILNGPLRGLRDWMHSNITPLRWVSSLLH